MPEQLKNLKGFLSQFEFRMKRKDGTAFPTEHSVIALEDKKPKQAEEEKGLRVKAFNGEGLKWKNGNRWTNRCGI